MNYVTKVAAKTTSKKTSEVGILINASFLTSSGNVTDEVWNEFIKHQKSSDPVDDIDVI